MDDSIVIESVILNFSDFECKDIEQTSSREMIISQLFERQVDLTPHQIAIICNNRTFTYHLLNEQSNRVAHHLRRRYTLKSKAPIALCFERSYEMVVSLLAILKVGSVYVPIDASYPSYRIQHMIKDTACCLILVGQAQASIFNEIVLSNTQLVLYEEDVFQLESNQNLPISCKPNDPAYVLYTSGTSGGPKGVIVPHQAIIRLVKNTNYIYIDSTDCIAQVSSIGFDAATFEIWSALLNGACLALVSSELLVDFERFSAFLEYNGISILLLTPVLFNKLVEQMPYIFRRLTYLLIGGDKISLVHVMSLLKTPENMPQYLLNAYGPTENTTITTTYVISPELLKNTKVIPIGRPINDTNIYILDEKMTQVPVGVIGELCIGGMGLASGYLNLQELTAERFIINPFATELDKKNGYTRLYRTGDLARWLVDGNIEYIGRNDLQVKIRGYRIELEEIEQVLLSYSSITQAAVILQENGQSQYLAAYYQSTHEIVDELIVQYLKQYLPDFMIPRAFMRLMLFPLTVHGKLDRYSFPQITIKTKDEHSIFPRDELEIKISSIWVAVLGIPNIGASDDFFQIGGDSILSAQLVSKLRQSGIDCRVRDVYEYRTIERLTQYLKNQIIHIEIDAEQGILEGSFDLLPIQKWFFDQSIHTPEHWNQAFLVRVPQLSIERLEAIIPSLIEHHDMLRAAFFKNGQSEYQQHFNTSFCKMSVLYCDVSKFSESTRNRDLFGLLTSWQSAFNLSDGPLWCIGYLDGYSDGSARLFFALHNLIVDAVSCRTLINDVKRLYEGESLGIKKSSYRQWLYTIQQYADVNGHEIDFWLNSCHFYINELRSATKYLVPYFISHTWDEQFTQQLLRYSGAAYHTEVNDLLLTALSYCLSEWSGLSMNDVILEGHGRESISETIDVSETVGWFTTLYPVSLKTAKDNISDNIVHIKESLRSIPNKGIGYSALRYYGKDRRLYKQSLPSIRFNYLGQFDNQTGYWQVIEESPGLVIHSENTGDYLISIQCMIVERKLQVKFALKIDEKAGQKLIEGFITALKAITNHCLHQINHNKFIYTLSDFKTIKSDADFKVLPVHSHVDELYNSFPMTELQKSYLLGRGNSFEIGNIANHLYREFHFSDLNILKLEKIFNRLLAHHPELRTIFNENTLTQRHLVFDENTYYLIENNRYDLLYNESMLIAVRNELSHKVYDVSVYPLFCIKTSIFLDRIVVHCSLDLLLLDAKSSESLFSDLTVLFENENHVLQKTAISFRDYQQYVDNLTYSEWYKTDKAYWSDKLAYLPLRPNLPFLCEPSTIVSPIFKTNRRMISKAHWNKVKQKADDLGVSYASILLSIYGLVISMFSEMSDFLITLTLFNRYDIHSDVQYLWGEFTSTSLFGFSRSNDSAHVFFKKMHDLLMEDIAHTLYSGLQVQRDLMKAHQLDPKLAVSPIVFTCIVGDGGREKARPSYYFDKSELTQERYFASQTSQAWIDLQVIEQDEGLSSGWLYVSQLFDGQFVHNLNNLYCDLIEYVAEYEWCTALPIVNLMDTNQFIIERVNSNSQKELSDTLIDLFEHQVALFPNNIAVIDEFRLLNYQDIFIKSANIAHYLYQHYPVRHQLIGILSEKGYQQVVSTLGIMKSGAAYLPLHVEWPLKRMKEVLKEGKVSLLLVSRRQWDLIKNTDLIIDFCVHIIEEIEIENENDVTLPSILLDDLAYVIFTSGSTGKPKGVCITHRAVVNTVYALNDRLNISQSDSVLSVSDLSFDLSVYDIFGVLGGGGKIVFPSQLEVRNPIHWKNLIKLHGITLWNTVPQLAQLLFDESEEDEWLRTLKFILMSGDSLPLCLVSDIKKRAPHLLVMSLGGATEASIWSIWYEVTAVSPDWRMIPYGYPMPNQKIYVLNQFREHCPTGVPGDIYIGGMGLARGYWYDYEKTESSFIVHPTLGRLYKTGDMGKWNSIGYVEFLGRKDNQVKCNGYRVELEEITLRMMSFPRVKQALTRIYEDNIVAYLILDNERSHYYSQCTIIDTSNLMSPSSEASSFDYIFDALSTYLSEYLPSYMLPKFYQIVSEIPLTINGKIDYNALPVPTIHKQEPFTIPKTEYENSLCAIWQEVLGIDKISVLDDFYKLGGDSVRSIQVIAKLRQQGLSCTVDDIFKYRNIKKLAQHINMI